jgi:alkane 1-monooxygenase
MLFEFCSINYCSKLFNKINLNCFILEVELINLKMKSIQYLLAFVPAGFVAFSLFSNDIYTYSGFIFVFGFIPLLEFIFKPDHKNLNEDQINKNDSIFDWILYATLPVQYIFVVLFLYRISNENLTRFEITGMILSFGILCGNFGINAAHELGHRNLKIEQLMAKLLLLSSFYTHFFIEHNRGHHKNVSTPDDPASARMNEPVYIFWFRSIFGCYVSAWRIQLKLLQKDGVSFFSKHNEMLIWNVFQLIFAFAIYYFFNINVLFYYLLASLTGILLLETVNYIEHYGLTRNWNNKGIYERVQPWHSWNSDHILGRWMMFELSRHSDHHYKASKKYHTLIYHEKSPQMPTGYPGMMLLSLIPPLWFWVMNRKIKQEIEKLAVTKG